MYGNRRPIAARAASALLGTLVGLCMCATAHAADVATQRFKQPKQGGVITNAQGTARALDTTPVYVIAVMAGESVADVQLRENRKLSRSEKNVVKSQRIAEQANARAAIEAAGGRVVTSFQSALNGVKVRIPGNRVAALRSVPGVIDVRRINTYMPENFLGVQRVQAPFAWSGARGVRGENIKVAIIDTGIDYTHATFGGPGTEAAFDAAFATSTAPADSSMFGPGAPKVKGGIDLAGNDYNPASADPAISTPAPDPNPLDCNGHGTHVAGTAAGFGVLLDGSTYAGAYDQSTHQNAFAVGPGSAPRADLYAVKVFGCTGGTNLVTEALEWAVDNDMDVVNMSLGSAFGTAGTADAIATDNAVNAGVVVVTSAGNNGPIDYVTGSPGSATRAIATAATPAVDSVRTVDFDTTPVVNGVNANGADWDSPLTLPVEVLRNPDGSVSLGCNAAEYVSAGVTGKLVVVTRGTCARVARAVFGQQAGAAAVVMINNANTLPPFEGPITGNPDTGEQYAVTIPFFGIRGAASNDDNLLVARDGTDITLTEGAPLPTGTATFSSMGPRTGDSFLKPDITAPGEAIVSAGIGTGNGPATLSGTSMASPHVAGVAALARQAHPTWAPGAIKSAIINSGDPTNIGDYLTRRNGAGTVNAAAATGTSAIAFGDSLRTSLSFGLEEFKSAVERTKPITIKNTGSSAITFDATVTQQGSPHSAILSVNQVTVPARSERKVQLTLTVPAATAGNSDAYRDAAGYVTFTPTGNGNNGIALTVPYLLVPRVMANVNATLPKFKGTPQASRARLTNAGSLIEATADFYAWGLQSPNAGLGHADLRAAGVQSIPSGSNPIVVFAVNTYKGWSSGFNVEFDIFIDSDGDGLDDYVVFNVDVGLLTTGTRNGQHGAVIANLETNGLALNFLVDSRTDSSTMLLPVRANSIGLTSANPRMSYTVVAFDNTAEVVDPFNASATFNAFTPAITNGDFVAVAPNATVDVPLAVDSTEWALTPAKGVMIVTQDNKNGAPEAKLLQATF